MVSAALAVLENEEQKNELAEFYCVRLNLFHSESEYSSKKSRYKEEEFHNEIFV